MMRDDDKPVDAAKIPSGWLYVLGILVMFGGCGASMGLTLWQVSGGLESMERMVVPGEKEITLEADSYTLFYESRSVIDGQVMVSVGAGTLACSILSADGQAIKLRGSSVSKTYGVGSYQGQSVFEFDIPASGNYRVGCNLDGGTGVIALGDGFSVAVLAIGIIATLACFVIGLIIIWRTRKRRRSARSS
jgi:hypothetical protein